ncbi:flagellar hook-associated protein 1 FlgK [Azospirillum lipoferum]|uniref:Flagellar hook-associated protein 1 n=1 Tax=Azospirillum lipoferum TaxID=193 RepID=A0A5A9GEV8_AZOLI|nr:MULTISPECIES: flagellar hook-associated protein FlgK [Azospirillum]KAA0591849.1 flagellar hook-associated protein FlgK [Azospirillum lipoferum]MCP1614640.1 flagellar hook-associated protein 1 FlgK [Azospirillum lipoferum]MDW5537524.1 flagellar hook-associated protein FlgK [Azospirillum sp. NL1]
MSVQLALTAALSGLRTTQQQAAMVSHNLANATTAGYVRRDLDLSAVTTAGRGAGVRVDAVARKVDELLIRDARFETSRYSGQEARASALADYALVLGQPQDEKSVSTQLSKLQQAFARLHDMPNDDAARSAVVSQAVTLAGGLNRAAEAAQTVQDDARDRLQTSVDSVNTSLQRISDLNGKIATLETRGGDAGDLRDQRDRLLDQVSQEIGIRTYSREDGQVVVMTRNGQTLLDHPLAPGEQPLTLLGDEVMANGVALSAKPDSEIQSGRIMGYVQTIKQDMPRAMAQLDELATGLVQAFQGAEADPTQPGLFTDAGTAYGTTAGLASRIAVNDVVRTESWRVQSGVQAAAPLKPGDQTQIDKFQSVFTATRSFAATDMPANATLGSYATAMVSAQQGYRTGAESEMNARKISADTLETARINRDGVNIDDEMQKLQLIEQSYGASAQVVQVAGRMIDILLQIKG